VDGLALLVGGVFPLDDALERSVRGPDDAAVVAARVLDAGDGRRGA
jgi:hypothetical protein